jgi:transcriptional antiterminator NusG
VALKWYIIHTYSGFEQKVRNAILERAKARGLEQFVPEVLVPTETVEEMVKGERKLSSRKFYPG